MSLEANVGSVAISTRLREQIEEVKCINLCNKTKMSQKDNCFSNLTKIMLFFSFFQKAVL